MNWILLLEIIYILIVIFTCGRVIYDTQSTTKTFAYLLAIIFLPFIGIIIYFSLGINYRKRKIYSKKIFGDDKRVAAIRKQISVDSKAIFSNKESPVINFKKLALLILNQTLSPIIGDNDVSLLLNGENKFPKVFEALKSAKDHIHIEYYIFNDDSVGCKIIDLLIEKAKEGVKVRFIYDDFGSRAIRKVQVPRLIAAGVEAFPFYRIKLISFANRLNYRNHRKIIIIDGTIGFVGGINVSDKYVNSTTEKEILFWRDTHLMIEGPAVRTLQYIFIGDWNYCSGTLLEPKDHFFPQMHRIPVEKGKIVQIVASGPDSDTALIEQSLMQAINLAKEEILITTPYFIPGLSLLDCLMLAAYSGIKIKLLVPGISDSHLVNFAARSYYGRLMKAGAEIYRYDKGFVHAKTMVVDKQLAIVGTANMDIRSFDLNFEVNAIVYDEEIAKELSQAFYDDLNCATKIDNEQWRTRSNAIQLIEKIAGLFSPLM
ncbi:cardiolipin synthase [Aequorivita sp. H23M31]|uniref:Cardiolipin synthase n=1 Tax=Aequorivita ciconiae TaxID=2494375 RepID=A0A410G4Y5_9FLAO|nr:cardiolipin synthase [Aequorivita sp. H23M31]QAA82332.1 cardiolipin synthase [Aequorivita sp. H23M31]